MKDEILTVMKENIYDLFKKGGLLKRIIIKLYYSYFRPMPFKVRLGKDDLVHITLSDGMKMIFLNVSSVLELGNENIGYFHEYKLKKGDVVVDIGAFDGVFTVQASKLVGPKGCVLAFEPIEKNYNMLLENIKLNGLKNIIPIKKGLYSSEKKLRFDDAGDASQIVESGGIEISVTTLDKELKWLDISKINFLKMDIEGAEIETLKGCKQCLLDNDVHVAIATYHIVDGKRTAERIEEQLRELGYNAWTTYPSHLTTYGSKELLKRQVIE